MTSGITCVSIGVADLQPVQDLWVSRLGLEVLAQRAGPDSNLASMWGIDADRIANQLLLGSPGTATGRLHFVQFNDPQPAIRADAEPYDLGAKNIDVNCNDMHERVRLLKESGYAFRSDVSEYSNATAAPCACAAPACTMSSKEPSRLKAARTAG